LPNDSLAPGLCRSQLRLRPRNRVISPTGDIENLIDFTCDAAIVVTGACSDHHRRRRPDHPSTSAERTERDDHLRACWPEEAANGVDACRPSTATIASRWRHRDADLQAPSSQVRVSHTEAGIQSTAM